MFACLLTVLLGVEAENNLTVATTLGVLLTRLSWSLKHLIVPRISCEGVKISSWSTKGQKWPSGLAAVRCFLAPLMLSQGCLMPLHITIWGKCMPTQLLRAHQRKADRYCPFPKRRQQGGFWNVPKREVWSQGIWRTVVLLGTGIKPALSHTIYAPLFYILFFLLTTVSSPCCPMQGGQQWILLAGDKSAVKWLATWWSKETFKYHGNILALVTMVMVPSLEIPGQHLETEFDPMNSQWKWFYVNRYRGI